jgi:transcriptional regulator with GAF, ATPase, and Fis domain
MGNIIEKDDNVSDQFLEHFLPGQSPRLLELREEVLRMNVAHKNYRVIRSILLLGERGTGKSQLAEVIAAHLYWLRHFPDGSREQEWRRWPLKSLGVFAQMRRQTLTALPDQLAEDALFGHAKGAFTGADQARDGAFQSTGDVDLLLDEVGDASLQIQAKLLEVLETGLFRALGAKWDDKPKDTQVRVLAATNRNLSTDVTAMRFRADLLDRLSTFVIALPPLRESREQIPAILQRILSDWSGKFRLSDAPTVSIPDQEFVLNQYDWPGNIRELEHAVVAWFVWGQTRALKEIILENARRLQQGTTADTQDADSGMRGNIRSHLVLLSQEGAPRFDSFGAFSRRYGDFGLEVLDDLNRTGSVALNSLFTSSAASVQSQLSGWRKRRGTVRRPRRSRTA